MSICSIPSYRSITHVHLLAALRAELRNMTRSGTVVRVLDAGCGNGALIEYLHLCLSVLEPHLKFDFFGFDISGPGIQKQHFLEDAVRDLEARAPGVAWNERLLRIDAQSAWPFPSEFFDVVLTNQVLEHVDDHVMFFGELARVLKGGGISLNCFPVKECVWEGHLHMPLVHRIAGHQQRTMVIRFLSWLGFGKYADHRRKTGISLQEFSARHADFINIYTNYISAREMLRILKRRHLRGSFAYTSGLVLQKAASVVGLVPRRKYHPNANGVLESLAFVVLKRLSSVTLRIEKRDQYRNRYETASAQATLNGR